MTPLEVLETRPKLAPRPGTDAMSYRSTFPLNQHAPEVVFLGDFTKIYFPKRPLPIPTTYPLDNPDAEAFRQDILSYLKGVPMYVAGDSRRYYDMFPQDRENNQFRVNLMTVAIGGLRVIARCIRERNAVVADELWQIHQDMHNRLHGLPKGKSYHLMTAPGEKLELVHFMEDSLVRGLEIIALTQNYP
ncbi:hypothetical protein HYW66_00195 [Candidatus Microgenomates bacterium]|nr:hypothetical protein [Candidatus Microgenomates bacterium]